jgi:hypothetical protein
MLSVFSGVAGVVGTMHALIIFQTSKKINIQLQGRHNMTTTQITTTRAHELESVATSSEQVGISVITIMSALIGTWGVACLIGGLSQYGIVGLAKGWLTAVIG